MVLERDYQPKVLAKIRRMFPGCVIHKLDTGPGNQQGMPDWVILWGPLWASLEIKKSANARERPNQPYFVKQLNEMSFAAFIYPENEEEVLHDLQQAFESRRAACLLEP